MVIIGKIIINQIGITNITSKNIIKILDFDKKCQMLLMSKGRSCQERLSCMEKNYWRRREELQIESWSECGYGRKGLTNNGCACDHKRTKNEDTKGWYVV